MGEEGPANSLAGFRPQERDQKWENDEGRCSRRVGQLWRGIPHGGEGVEDVLRPRLAPAG
jgi:hypothetical protein